MKNSFLINCKKPSHCKSSSVNLEKISFKKMILDGRASLTINVNPPKVKGKVHCHSSFIRSEEVTIQ